MPEDHHEITLGVLNAVEENSRVTQRNVAEELGVALGLVNSYLKRCVKKGFVKVRHAPANRYAYYLTPAGFAEKSRLTAEYLSTSFNFFRNARRECTELLDQCAQRGLNRIALAGASDLAEIVVLCVQEFELEIVAVIDPAYEKDRFFAIPVVRDITLAPPADVVMVTSLSEPQATYTEFAATCPHHKVITPEFLGVSRQKPKLVS